MRKKTEPKKQKQPDAERKNAQGRGTDAFTSFSEYRAYQKQKKEVGRTGLFLCLFCAVLALVFYVRGLAFVGAKEFLSYCLAAFFAGIIVFYVCFPVALFSALHRLRPFTDRIGKVLLRALLVPVYLLLCLVALPFRGRQRKKYRFAAWDTEAPPEASFFTGDTQNVFGGGSPGAFRFLTALLERIAKNGQYFLFPVLVLLLLLGLFFYFISSSSILGFIYTLF